MATVGSARLQRIGDGPVATVYSGLHAGLPVALKVFPKRLDKRTLAAFNKEQAKLSATRRISSILLVDGVDDLDTGEFAVRMERCTQSLSALVDRVGSLRPADAVVLGRSVALALATAHAAGVVHGGMSPHNILFRTTGEPVLADFGVTLRQAFARDPLYAIEFLPPETLRTGVLNESTDLYGLGAVLHYALSGRSPHPGRLGEQPGERVLRILGEPVPALNAAEVPVPLATLVARLLSADPTRRLGDASAVADQLSAMLPDTPQPPPTDDFDDFSAPQPMPPSRPFPLAHHAPPYAPGVLDEGNDFDDFAMPGHREAPRPPVAPPGFSGPPAASPGPAPVPAAPPRPVVPPTPPVTTSPAAPARRPANSRPVATSPAAPAPPPANSRPVAAAPSAPASPLAASPSAGVSLPAGGPASSPTPHPAANLPAAAWPLAPAAPLAASPSAGGSASVPVSPSAGGLSPAGGPASCPTPHPAASLPAAASPSVPASSLAASPSAGAPPSIPAPPPVVPRPEAPPAESADAGAAPAPSAGAPDDAAQRRALRRERLRSASVTPSSSDAGDPAEAAPEPAPQPAPEPAAGSAPGLLPLASLGPASSEADAMPTEALPTPATVEFQAQRRGAAVARPDIDFDDDFPAPLRGRAQAKVLAGPLAPPGAAPKKLIRYDLLAGGAILLALLALVPLLLFRGESDEPSSVPHVPPAAGSGKGDVEIVLAEPVDLTDAVRLSWTADEELDFVVVVAPEGKETQFEFPERNLTMTLPVDLDLQYCFQVQATDGDDTYESNVVSLRDATCKE